jgi:hypothetical protein
MNKPTKPLNFGSIAAIFSVIFAIVVIGTGCGGGGGGGSNGPTTSASATTATTTASASGISGTATSASATSATGSGCNGYNYCYTCTIVDNSPYNINFTVGQSTITLSANTSTNVVIETNATCATWTAVATNGATGTGQICGPETLTLTVNSLVHGGQKVDVTTGNPQAINGHVIEMINP